MPASESPAHRELKRLSLIWAQANGYPIAGCEVSLPNLRFRLDVGAYRPPRQKRVAQANPGSAGAAAIFECKAGRADLIRDCRSAARLTARLQKATALRGDLERLMRNQYPSLRQGDGLWPEYETFAFEKVTDARYGKVLREIGVLSRQLHAGTKMETLLRWEAANLHYLVVEPKVVDLHEVPVGWGLLVRVGDRLEPRGMPAWRDVPEANRLAFLHRLAASGTKATNREAGVNYHAIECERRGVSPPSEGALNPASVDPCI